jgi:hypothetical protein
MATSALSLHVPDHIRAGYDEPLEEGAPELSRGLPRYVPVFSPELYPIPDAQEFNPAGSIATAAVESKAIPIAPQYGPDASAITLPGGNIGIIRSFSISITNMLTTTNVTFTLLVNGGPVGGYGGISITPRVSPYVNIPFDCFIRLPNAAKVTASFNNIDGGNYVVGVTFGGWFWPLTSGIRWMQFGN